MLKIILCEVINININAVNELYTHYIAQFSILMCMFKSFKFGNMEYAYNTYNI